MPTIIDGTNGIDKIAAGAIEYADLPAGSVLQVVNANTSTQQTLATESWNDLSGLSVSITPKSTSSRILVMWSVQGQGSGTGYSVRALRNSTSIFTPATFYDTFINSGIFRVRNVNFQIDSPSTTSATTYKLQAGTHSSGTVNFQDGSNFQSSITVMEIA